MLQQLPSESSAGKAGPGTVELALQQAFYPMTMPLTIGPGCISVCIAFGAHIREQSNTAHLNYVMPFLGGIAGMALVCFTLWLCDSHAGRLAEILGALLYDSPPSSSLRWAFRLSGKECPRL